MALGRTQVLLLMVLYLCTDLAAADESTELQNVNDKRYIAALAKNGRLPPKSGRSELKREGDEEFWPVEHEENPDLGEPEDPDLFYFNDEDSRSQEAGAVDKRYLGAFLNSRGRPRELLNEADGQQQTVDKRYIGAVFNSRGKPTMTNADDADQNTGKRNIASLARKGWLSAIRSYRSPMRQRMPPPRRYSSYNDKRDDSLYSDEPRVIMSDADDCIDEPESSESGQVEKRNIAFLARNGMLPPRKSFSDPFSPKRNRPAFMPRASQLRWSLPVPKALRSGGPRLVKIKTKRCPSSGDSKRNVAAMARKGLLPNKKNVAAMARKGLLPVAGN